MSIIARNALVLLLQFVFVTGVFSQESESVTNCGAFSVCAPKGFQITKKSLSDFDLVGIAKDEKTFLVIYVGNQPKFPNTNGTKYKMTRLALGDVQMISEWDGNRLKSREMKVKISDKSSPMYIHVSTGSGLSDEEVMIADRIISSIRAEKKK